MMILKSYKNIKKKSFIKILQITNNQGKNPMIRIKFKKQEFRVLQTKNQQINTVV